MEGVFFFGFFYISVWFPYFSSGHDLSETIPYRLKGCKTLYSDQIRERLIRLYTSEMKTGKTELPLHNPRLRVCFYIQICEAI